MKSIADINTLRLRQNGRRFADDTFKRIFLNENGRIFIKISLRFVPKGPINNNPALVQIMAWRQSGNKPLSEPMMVSLLTHICITRPQWVKPILTFKWKDSKQRLHRSSLHYWSQQFIYIHICIIFFSLETDLKSYWFMVYVLV